MFRLEEVVAGQKELQNAMEGISRNEGWRVAKEEANSLKLADIQTQL